MKHSIGLLAVALFSIIAGSLVFHYLPTSQEQSKIPSISLPDVNGIQHNLVEWQDKIIILNFWASWCAPCREEIPEFITLQTSLSDEGLQFIGIAIDELEAVKTFIDSMGINYPILMAEENGIPISIKLGNSLNILPFSVVIDRQGTVVYSHSGAFRRKQIMEIVKPLLNPG